MIKGKIAGVFFNDRPANKDGLTICPVLSIVTGPDKFEKIFLQRVEKHDDVPFKKGQTVEARYKDFNGYYHSFNDQITVIEDNMLAPKKESYVDGARRGQALNLAVAVAVAEGKHEDDDYILEQVSRFLELSDKVQNS